MRPTATYGWATIRSRCTREEAWVVIDGGVYDVTRFLQRHPGGAGPLVAYAGRDATDAFVNYHDAKVHAQLAEFAIGRLDERERQPPPAHVADFRALRRELARRGLFQTSGRYYARLCAWYALLLATALHLSLNCTQLGARMLGAVALGLFWQQLAGLGHDLGHSAVTHHFWTDHFIGSALSALMGLSVCWWKNDHNTHHVACNAIEHDPNVQHLPLLAITDKIFRRARFWDTYHRRWVGMGDAARFFVTRQHLLLYPLLAVGRWNLYAQSVAYILHRPDAAHFWRTEAVGIGFFFWWVSRIATTMPTWPLAAAWVMLAHAVAGILHVQIVLSHWPMHAYQGHPRDDWYLATLRTTMNVRTPERLDWMHIGLQFQIEHHLFPRVPRHNLRTVRDLVQPVVEKHFPTGSVACRRAFGRNAAYHESSFLDANLQMWRALRATAQTARRTVRHRRGYWHAATSPPPSPLAS